jgi:hypothetical protein
MHRFGPETSIRQADSPPKQSNASWVKVESTIDEQKSIIDDHAQLDCPPARA